MYRPSGSPKPTPPIEVMRVACVQPPLADVRERTFGERELHHLHSQPASAVFPQDVHVGDVGDRVPVRDDPHEADLLFAVAQTDHARRIGDGCVHDLAGPSDCPVRLSAQELVDRLVVDPGRIVVQFVPVPKVAPHRATLASLLALGETGARVLW